MDVLLSRGLLMAWWMLIPGLGIAAMWLLAVFADREQAEHDREMLEPAE